MDEKLKQVYTVLYKICGDLIKPEFDELFVALQEIESHLEGDDLKKKKVQELRENKMPLMFCDFAVACMALWCELEKIVKPEDTNIETEARD